MNRQQQIRQQLVDLITEQVKQMPLDKCEHCGARMPRSFAQCPRCNAPTKIDEETNNGDLGVGTVSSPESIRRFRPGMYSRRSLIDVLRRLPGRVRGFVRARAGK